MAVPNFGAGAMENWGLVIYREASLLYNSITDTIANKRRVSLVVAHELAHQWYGNLVTMEWWTDLWLNEGFASWVENLGLNRTHPEWRDVKQIELIMFYRLIAFNSTLSYLVGLLLYFEDFSDGNRQFGVKSPCQC